MFGCIRFFVIKCNGMCVEKTKHSICRLLVVLTKSIWDVCIRLFEGLKYLRVKYFEFLKQGVFQKKNRLRNVFTIYRSLYLWTYKLKSTVSLLFYCSGITNWRLNCVYPENQYKLQMCATYACCDLNSNHINDCI